MEYRFKEIMSQKNVTGRELSERLGKAPQYVNAIVKERSGASVRMLRKFAEALDVPFIEIFN